MSEHNGKTQMNITNRAKPHAVALETTLLVHGVPTSASRPLADNLSSIVQNEGAHPCLIGVVNGSPTAGMTNDELTHMLDGHEILKANTANLGVAMHKGLDAATTVSTTMEISAAAGIKVFATGGIGGVHKDYGNHLDISSDLAAFTRFPVAVVTSGVKSILDVTATREALETLGILVIGYQTDSFPAFYLRESSAGVDVRIDDPDELASFVNFELERTRRGIVVANPIPHQDELDADHWNDLLAAAEEHAKDSGAQGRAMTPTILGQLHTLSNGATLDANLALVRSNTKLAAQIASRI
ncbi:MAG: pseudouridine-5'-phosphate glycosidase [Phycisphaerales bacterium]